MKYMNASKSLTSHSSAQAALTNFPHLLLELGLVASITWGMHQEILSRLQFQIPFILLVSPINFLLVFLKRKLTWLETLIVWDLCPQLVRSSFQWMVS